MLVNYYYGGPTTYVVTEKIRQQRDTITVPYGEIEISYASPDGNLKKAIDTWVDDIAMRKNHLYRVTVEDTMAPVKIKWDSDLAVIQRPRNM